MCGIWASFGWAAPRSEDIAHAGVAAASHRGPDREGFQAFNTGSGTLYLGHKRLSIYDPSPLGAQPMQRGRLSVVFNGSLYDHHEIRAELEAIGHVFQTTCDTEVLLAAWLEWGPSAMSKFDGMFALALYEHESKSLYLARDRFGEKPLHICQSEQGLMIASEISQILASGGLEVVRGNRDIIRDFLDFGIAEQGSATFVSGIERLRPGFCRRYDLSGAKPTIVDEFGLFPAALPATDKTLMDHHVVAEALKSALQTSVNRRMTADVKVGSCLSGGVDSSIIVAMASAFAPTQTLSCFCASFDGNGADGNSLSEWPYAEAVAESVGAALHLVQPDAQQAVANLDHVLAHQGEPFSHTSILAQYEVFKSAKAQGITVMLDGQGADEFFGGYAGMLGHRLADILTTKGMGAWQREVAEFSADGADLDAPTLKRATFNALVPEGYRRRLAKIRGRWPQPYQMTVDEMSPDIVRAPGLDRFESLMRGLQQRNSLPGLLRYEDRNAMSHAIESRLPYLGRDVVDLAWKIPGHLKARAGWTKAILRDCARGLVPEEILRRRRKLGFITPQDQWMVCALGDWVVAGIEAAKRHFPDLLSPTGVDAVIGGLRKDTQANQAGFRLACLGHWAVKVGLTG